MLAFISLGFLLLTCLVPGLLVKAHTTDKIGVPLLCVVFMLAVWYVPPLGRAWKHSQFKAHIDEFEPIVKDVKEGKILCTSSLRQIKFGENSHVPRGVIDIQAARRSDGVAIVIFLTSAAGRIHSGYFYNESGAIGSGMLQVNMPNKQLYFNQIAANLVFIFGLN